MSRCQRFGNKELRLLEEGRPLDAHFATCPDCLAAQQSYERLKLELASLDPAEPPARWEDRVWNAIEKGKRKGKRSPVRAFLIPAFGLAAAALVAVLLLPPMFVQSGPPSMLAEFQAGSGPIQRGGLTPDAPVPPGTYLILNANSGGARYAELRVYRGDDQLIFQTAHVMGRFDRDDALHVRVVLEAVGRYQAALFSSDQPIPPPSGSADGDFVASRQTGATLTLHPAITVR
jgi:hypothetical protein